MGGNMKNSDVTVKIFIRDADDNGKIIASTVLLMETGSIPAIGDQVMVDETCGVIYQRRFVPSGVAGSMNHVWEIFAKKLEKENQC